MSKIYEAYIQSTQPIINKEPLHKVDDNTNNDFVSILKEVNQLQVNSSDLKEKFQMGDPTVTLEKVMLTSEKANIGFEAVLRIRNKFIETYKEIMNMQL